MRDSYRIEWLEPAKQNLRDIVFYLIDKAPLVAIGIQENLTANCPYWKNFRISAKRMPILTAF